jgi:16S rRNA (cytosine1402-N4)-methyltransferase
LEECLEYLNIRPDGIYVDGTIGGAGHSAEIYKRLGNGGILVGLDQDEYALKVSSERLSQLDGQAARILVHTNFRNIMEACRQQGITGVNGILLDLGVSSYQLDEAERGFSYQKNAPLDMRMNKKNDLTAETIVNEYSEKELGDIIRDYGEEKWAKRIAAFIVSARDKGKIETTLQLVDIIKAAIPSAARRDGPHPAKRTFQAIRIAVNNELGILKQTIEDAVSVLVPGGRLCIITFHSLEDRIVKNEYQRMADPCTCPREFPVCVCGAEKMGVQITRKPIAPSAEETQDNPRARSAKLRVLEKV